MAGLTRISGVPGKSSSLALPVMPPMVAWRFDHSVPTNTDSALRKASPLPHMLCALLSKESNPAS
jgi:hypothetical protein